MEVGDAFTPFTPLVIKPEPKVSRYGIRGKNRGSTKSPTSLRDLPRDTTNRRKTASRVVVSLQDDRRGETTMTEGRSVAQTKSFANCFPWSREGIVTLN